MFCCEGRVIASIGEKAKKLSLYSVEDGSALSRGMLDFEATSLAVDSGDTRKMVVACNKKVTLLKPVYK